MVGLVLLGGFAVAEAGGKKGELVHRVKVDFSTIDFAPGTKGAKLGTAFYVTGDICAEPNLLDEDCTPIGTFHCWGWITDFLDPESLAVVSQEYGLDGRGKIQVQGVEDEVSRAVTRGTSDFRNVRGEATGFNFDKFFTDGEFIVTFKLKGAKK